jgi:hypothetical protein
MMDFKRLGAKRFEVALVEDEIAYYESVGDVSPSTSISGLSMSIPDPSTNIPSLSTSWDDIGCYKPVLELNKLG